MSDIIRCSVDHTCPRCDRFLTIPLEEGTAVKCPSCGQLLDVDVVSVYRLSYLEREEE